MAAHQAPPHWDSPGKNTGVGCHFLLQCMKVKSESEVAESCPTLSDPMNCNLLALLSMGFSRQDYWSGVPLPSPCLLAQGCNSIPGRETMIPYVSGPKKNKRNTELIL